MSETPITWPPRQAAPEAFRFAARLLAAFELAVLGVLPVWMLIAALLNGDTGRTMVFSVGTLLGRASADGFAFGTVAISWPPALAVTLSLAAGSLFAVVRLVRHDPGPLSSPQPHGSWSSRRWSWSAVFPSARCGSSS